MKAMMEQTGLASKEKTIIFSLPVTSTVGLRMYIDEMDMDEMDMDEMNMDEMDMDEEEKDR